MIVGGKLFQPLIRLYTNVLVLIMVVWELWAFSLGGERIDTRGKAHNFHTTRITNTFAYTSIKNWNILSPTITNIKSENLFKEKIKRYLAVMSNNKKNFDKKWFQIYFHFQLFVYSNFLQELHMLFYIYSYLGRIWFFYM